jgi:hypothetical protein
MVFKTSKLSFKNLDLPHVLWPMWGHCKFGSQDIVVTNVGYWVIISYNVGPTPFL